MHDPTEGGLATALHELSSASGLGVEVDLMSVHVFPETAAICATLGLDPLGLIASGALLAVVAAPDVDTAIAAVEREGVRAARIGSMLDPDGGAWFAGTPRRPLPEFPVDEIARYFSSQPVRSEA
jgi:hydrogenase expression/formation protein HypE